jgi:hypothetical protein
VRDEGKVSLREVEATSTRQQCIVEIEKTLDSICKINGVNPIRIA